MSPINYIVSQGFNCFKCGKSISYPNKLMRIILEKSGIDFEYEKKFEWSFNKLSSSKKTYTPIDFTINIPSECKLGRDYFIVNKNK